MHMFMDKIGHLIPLCFFVVVGFLFVLFDFGVVFVLGLFCFFNPPHWFSNSAICFKVSNSLPRAYYPGNV